MIDISYLGILIILSIYLPKIIYLFFPAKDRIINKYNSREKQIKILEKISFLGCLVFSFLDIQGYGYKFYNLGLEIAWIIIFILLVLFNYFCFLRFYIKGRNNDDLYNKLLIPYPIGISEIMIFVISGAILLNPFVIVFSIIYAISHIYLGIRRK